jgi:MoaA/NifB/PqqE/SkfB family radical SAM enzyme
MNCKFLKHGMAIKYDQIVTPCCVWKSTTEYTQSNHLDQVNIVNWHKSKFITEASELLANGQWPESCSYCKLIEDQGRGDSMRLSGESAYSYYGEDDITLEIRPGSVCNFACQTCWPEASSRVAEYHVKAGLISRNEIISNSFTDFDQLLPIASRIKNVNLLGGEPFYDPSCKKFLAWAKNNLSADILMFTNGSMIDWDFLTTYSKKITLVFSLDATGTPAEYIRLGTEWATVLSNYKQALALPNVAVRVNITMSVYNYLYLEELFDVLCEKWPEVVSFGTTFSLPYLGVASIPLSGRSVIIDSLTRVKQKIVSTKIEQGQWHNAVNAIQSIITQLQTGEFNQELHTQLIDVVAKLDTVKYIKLEDYCPELAEVLQYKSTKLLI